MFPRGEVCVRLRATVVEDPYSGELVRGSWAAPDELVLPSCAFAPGASGEVESETAVTVTEGPTLYVHERADVRAGDRIWREATGITYDVDGHPQWWQGVYVGRAGGMVIRLKEVS